MNKFCLKTIVATFCLLGTMASLSCEREIIQEDTNVKKIKQVTIDNASMSQYLLTYTWDGDLLSRVDFAIVLTDYPEDTIDGGSAVFSYSNGKLSRLLIASNYFGNADYSYTWNGDQMVSEEGCGMVGTRILYDYSQGKVSQIAVNDNDSYTQTVILTWDGDNLVAIGDGDEAYQEYAYDDGKNPFHNIPMGFFFNHSVICPMSMAWSSNNMTKMISHEEEDEVIEFTYTYDADKYPITMTYSAYSMIMTYHYTYYEVNI